MPRTKGTAREFVLNALRQHADNELQVADLHALAGGSFTKDNLANLMPKLLAEGLVERTTEGRSAWWAIAQPGLGVHTPEQPEPDVQPEQEREPATAQPATMEPAQPGCEMQQEPEAQDNAEPVAPPAPEPQAMQNPEPEPTLVLESMPAAASVAVPDVLEPEAVAQVVSGPDAHDTPVTGAQPDTDAPRGFFGYARTWAGRFMRPRGGGADDKA